MFRLKIYRVQREILVAVCDSDIVGRIFREGDLRLEVKESFYGNKEVGRDEVVDALKRATIANITGKKAVELAVEIGIIDKDRILVIDGCPHAQMVVM